MPTFKPKNPTKNKMEFEVDLEKAFGVKIPSKELRETIGQAIIDTLVDRTQGKKSLTGGKFAKYSKAYADKKGVGLSDVNLTLTEDMLTSINPIANTTQKIKIKLDKNESPKGFNHHTGDTLPRREWFGIQQKELSKLVKEFKPKVEKDIKKQIAKEIQGKEDEEIDSIIDNLTKGLFDFG